MRSTPLVAASSISCRQGSSIQLPTQAQTDYIRHKVHESTVSTSSDQTHIPTPMSFQAFSDQSADAMQQQLRNDIGFCRQATERLQFVNSIFRSLEFTFRSVSSRSQVSNEADAMQRSTMLILNHFGQAEIYFPEVQFVSEIHKAFNLYSSLISSLNSFQHGIIDIFQSLPIENQKLWRQRTNIDAPPAVVNIFSNFESMKSLVDSVVLFVDFI
jgi:hypothetical protein